MTNATRTLGIGASLLMFTACPGFAGETVTYTYDALGRLAVSNTAGGPNNAVNTTICLDAAGNRTRYVVNTGGSITCPATGTPTSPPPQSNQPPTAVADTLSLPCNTEGPINLIANDSDPDNNVPLQLVSISRTSGTATAVRQSTTTAYVFTELKGVSVFAYVVADSLGAISTGQLTVTSTGNAIACAGGTQ